MTFSKNLDFGFKIVEGLMGSGRGVDAGGGCAEVITVSWLSILRVATQEAATDRTLLGLLLFQELFRLYS